MNIAEFNEVPEAYKNYVKEVRNMPVMEALTSVKNNVIPDAILEVLGDKTYSEGKWTVKEILQHIIDTERVFAYRTLRFARKDKTPLPGFDQDLYVASCTAGTRTIADLLGEVEIVRAATIALFQTFSKEQMQEKGTASGATMSVEVAGYIIAGHLVHHMNIIRQKYFPLLKDETLITIENYRPEWKRYFEQFNKAWIEKYFTLEPLDKQVLENPEEAILNAGGKIYFALFNGEVIGAAALMKVNDTTFELTKMAVDERYRGLGAGKLLCETSIKRAREMGVQKLILYTQTALKTALSIYHKLGFKEVPLEKGVYARADVKMEMELY